MPHLLKGYFSAQLNGSITILNKFIVSYYSLIFSDNWQCNTTIPSTMSFVFLRAIDFPETTLTFK